MKKVFVSMVIVLLMVATVFAAPTAKWTYMVFLNGDNNLEGAGIDDVNEMEKIGSNADVNIIVMMDRVPGYDSSNGDWKGTKMFYITKDNDPKLITSKVLKDMGEVDTGKYSEVVNFVKFCATEYPAEKYGLVLWNHGAGWKKKAQEQILTKGVCYDDTNGSHITTVQLSIMSKEISEFLGKKLDVLNYDACLMQMAEIVYQTRSDIEAIAGAEETEPGDGDPYDDILGALVAKPEMTGCDLAVVIAEKYTKSYTAGSQGNSAVCKSAVSSAKIEEVAQAVDAFAKALIPVAAEKATDLKTIMYKTQKYAYADYKDLTHFAKLVKDTLKDKADVVATADLVITAVKNAVLFNGVNGAKVKDSYGLSIYIPLESEYRPNYKDLAWNDTAWNQFLQAYFAAIKAKDGGINQVEVFVKSLESASQPYDVDMIFDELVLDIQQKNTGKIEAFITYLSGSQNVNPIIKAVTIKVKSFLTFLSTDQNYQEMGDYLQQLNAIIIE